jgi:hypothetical protein
MLNIIFKINIMIRILCIKILNANLLLISLMIKSLLKEIDGVP